MSKRRLIQGGSAARNLAVGALLLVTLAAAVPALADPYPPYWDGGTGTSIHYFPSA